MMTGIVRRRTSLLRAACAAVLLFAVYVPAAFAQEQVIYYKTDAVGSVRMITDANGQVLQRYDYLPFGDPWPSQSDVEDPRRFAGQERDSETALGYSGARRYESQTGRFTSPDTPGIDQDPFDPQSRNLYTYVRNDPVPYTDPDGRKCVNGKDSDTGNFCAENDPVDLGQEQFFWNSFFDSWNYAGERIAQPIINLLTAPRDQACMAASVGIGASIGGVAGGLLGGAGGGTGGRSAERSLRPVSARSAVASRVEPLDSHTDRRRRLRRQRSRRRCGVGRLYGWLEWGWRRW